MGERAATASTARDPLPLSLVDRLEQGLAAPICLTWELTYACNLACVHCLSSSGRRDPRELSAAECRAVIDELARMQVFYVNIGGGEPTVRPDFMEILDYAVGHGVGVKFSTNGVKITPGVARRLAAADYVDVQISLDGATAEVNDAVRGTGSHATAMRAIRNLAAAGFTGFKISVVVTRHNAGQLDAFKGLADRYGAQLRLTRLRPSGRGAAVWRDLHLTARQQQELYRWLLARGEQVLTGDSFFHLAGYGDPLPGLGMCGAGRVVCLIDPLPDRPGGRRVCVPVHDPPGFPGRKRARRGRIHPGVAGFAAVHRAAWPAGGGRVPLVRDVRRLPGRVHGRQVLHRPSPGWPRPRVRAGPRGASPGGGGPARRPGPVG